MSVFNSVGSPLVVLMVILLVAGSIFGIAVSGADFFNPATSNAEADRIAAETSHQQAIFEQTERLTNVQTDAQIEALQREQEIAKQEAQLSLSYEQQLNEKKLTAYESFMQILNTLLWGLGIAISTAIILATGLILGPKALIALRVNNTHPQAPAKTNIQTSPFPVDLWKSEEFRKRMVKNARENESVMRQAMFKNQNIQPFYNPANISRDQLNKLPWAE